MRTRKAWIIFLNIVLPLATGGAVYIFFKKGTWVSTFFQTAFKIQTYKVGPGLLRILINVLPDFCWSYSLSFALLLLLRLGRKGFLLPGFIILLLLLLSEIIQIWMPSAFTFDPLDLFAVGFAFFLALFCHAKLTE